MADLVEHCIPPLSILTEDMGLAKEEEEEEEEEAIYTLYTHWLVCKETHT